MANIELPNGLSFGKLVEELGLKTKHAEIYLRYALKQTLLFDKKQQDYGPHNIAKFGTQGVIIRMNDKMERLITLAGSKRKKARNESIQDTFQDISVYGVIAQMLEDNNWPLT